MHWRASACESTLCQDDCRTCDCVQDSGSRSCSTVVNIPSPGSQSTLNLPDMMSRVLQHHGSFPAGPGTDCRKQQASNIQVHGLMTRMRATNRRPGSPKRPCTLRLGHVCTKPVCGAVHTSCWVRCVLSHNRHPVLRWPQSELNMTACPGWHWTHCLLQRELAAQLQGRDMCASSLVLQENTLLS